MMGRITVGIDVSKNRLDVALRPIGERFSVERNAAGLELLIARVRELSPHVVALEATGGFETVAAAALSAANLPVAVVNPSQIRAFAKAIGQRAKTDPIDADVIALKPPGLNLARSRTRPLGSWRTWSRADDKSWR